MAEGPNLFARLHKWASRQDENFLTESLAVVLEQLLILAPRVGTRLIGRLTGGFISLDESDAGSIVIRTQVETAKGRPDLEISIPHQWVWVEVKAESELRPGQLEGYYVGLGELGIPATRLILLTKYPATYDPEQARPSTEIRWFQLAAWLEEELPAIDAAGEVAGFLARQYLGFLRERRMTLTHVGPYMPDGVRALWSLINMLMEAAAVCKVSAQLRAGKNWIGLTVDDRKYWIGVGDDPDKVWFGTNCQIDTEAASRLDEGEVEEARGYPGGYRWWRSADLNSEEVHFFSRTKVSQMELLEGFLRECLETARKIEVPNQPPLPEEPEGV